MKALRELVDIVTKHKKKQMEVIGLDKDSPNRYDEFYDLLVTEQLSTEQDAAQHFFGKDKSASFTQYRNFRNKFFRRLVNAVFLLDVKKPMFNELQTAMYHIRKNTAAAGILAAKGATHAAIELAEKTIKPAIQYEATTEILELARLIKFKYAFLTDNHEKHLEAQAIVDKSLLDLNLLVKAESLYYDITKHYTTSRSTKPKVAALAEKYKRELEKELTKSESFKFRYFYFLIAKLSYTTRNDYRGSMKVCREAISDLKRRKAAPPSVIAAFLRPLLVAATMLKQFDEAESAVAELTSSNVPGAHNWYKSMELIVLFRLHQQNYQEAYRVFKQARNHKRFSHLSAANKEQWYLFEAYVHLLIAMGKIKRSEAEEKRLKLRPARLLNQMPLFSKDKRGLNIPILIVHAIYLLHLRRYEEAYDRMQALEKYADRHLKAADDSFRSYCFIKALSKIPASDFNPEAAQQATADMLREMGAQPLQFADTQYELEYMPYEHLWALAMEALMRSDRII
ncbi:hypothetical protein [Phaeodactylibacter sp.]|uniref:hypothetical protein n=1 Tax=Phaeodactylibacter sp. TaxID=1940289 RepID=UPI0025CC96E3|nr:hypothetical protein [Phaeodactylibacter sp.]MCI4650413.1 hypothetical protein [Phaeodactylibacter sp.]MCI5093873.1 hypothetical protein [Phaeodactylibacter sp.]